VLPLKRLVKGVLTSPARWGALAPLRRPVCLVLAYHRVGRPGLPFTYVDSVIFRRQMKWLQRHCHLIGPDDLRSSAGARNGRPHVLITFDDGYRDYYELAYPILKELGIPAVNFLSTRFIDDGGLFWWDALTLALVSCRKQRVVLPWKPENTYELDARGRRELNLECRVHVSNAPAEARDAILAEIARAIDVDLAAMQAPRQVMTWDEVRATMDVTTYGGHTHTHVRVSRVDAVTLEHEIRTCRARLQAETGTAPSLFAYPTGDASDIAKRLLPACGFDIAFSIIEGYVDHNVDWLDVRRFPAPSSVGQLAWVASGWSRAH
jgi:peptidoglycan/xylan/chitin deacetylase (PgdA/CDA1 family)